MTKLNPFHCAYAHSFGLSPRISKLHRVPCVRRHKEFLPLFNNILVVWNCRRKPSEWITFWGWSTNCIIYLSYLNESCQNLIIKANDFDQGARHYRPVLESWHAWEARYPVRGTSQPGSRRRYNASIIKRVWTNIKWHHSHLITE